MKKSKIISTCLAAVMLAGVCAGCMSAGGGDEFDTVTIWSENSHSKQVYDQLVQEFNEGIGKKNQVKVEYQVIDGDGYLKSIEVALQNGQGPDLFGLVGGLRKNVENGYLMEVNELPGMEKYLERAKAKNLLVEERHMVDGKIYALPQGATTQGLVYNKEMFKAAGIVDENGEAKPPETLEEMREDAKKLTNTDKSEYGIILPIKWSGWYNSDIGGLVLSTMGYDIWNPVTGEYDYAKLKPILEMYIGMKQDGSIFPGAEGLDNDQARSRFAAGKIGMKMAFSFDVGVYNDQFPAQIDWGVAPYPVADKNNVYRQRMDIGTSFGINAKATEHISLEKLALVYDYFVCDKTVQILYENGMSIPADADVVNINTSADMPKGWQEFCDLVEISAVTHLKPKSDWTALKGISQLFMEEVWPGNMSIDDAIALAQKNSAIAEQQYYSKNTNEDPKDYLNPDWNIKR